MGMFIVISKSKKEEIDETEKKFQDIKKRYEELIIYSKNSKLPIVSRTVTVDSIDDLVKAAEQIDKPIINS